MKHCGLLVLITLFLVSATLIKTQAESPKVVVSLKPLHSLVSAVMQGVGEPELLMDPTQSAHHFQLKPSQVEKIHQADLVVWISPHLETALAKPLSAATAQMIEISKLPGVTLLPARDDQCQHHHDHGHVCASVDLHLWLDPVAMKAMVDAVVLQLAQIDPPHATLYKENGLAVGQMLDNLDKELTEQFKVVKDKKYMVYHDSYQYLEKNYGLEAPLVMALNHLQAPSAKKMNELKQQIQDDKIYCIFVEPQLPAQQASILADRTKIKVAAIDPLGIVDPAGPSLYPAMMRTLVKTMVDCLN